MRVSPSQFLEKVPFAESRMRMFPSLNPLAGPRTISGRHHPALRLEGMTAPCFLLGPGRIIPPAFSQNAAGCNLLTDALPRG